MTEQLAIDFTSPRLGRALAEQGMARTLDAEREGWLEQALAALLRFTAEQGAGHFKMEDFRAWYVAQGLPAPHSHKCWGAFSNRAEKAKVITFTGRYTAAVSPKTHGHMVKVWKATDFVDAMRPATSSPASNIPAPDALSLSESADFRVGQFLRSAAS